MTEFELILMQEMLKAYLIAFKDPFQNDKWPLSFNQLNHWKVCRVTVVV